MMDITIFEFVKLGVPLLAIGGAYGGAKVAINGTRERSKETRDLLSEHIKEDESLQREMIDRAARMETKLDMLIAMEKK
jgi:hypothetical protein